MQLYILKHHKSRAQPRCKSWGSGWVTDGARVEEGVGTVAVAAP